LDGVQKRLGIVFPLEFREHYLKYNGGTPQPNCFPFDGDYYCVHQFFPITSDRDPSLTLEHTYELVKDALPHDLVPFADDAGGDFFCFSSAKSSFGTIYFICADDFDEPHQGVLFFADNLYDFLKKLVPYPENG
jgi:hypothetical protein